MGDSPKSKPVLSLSEFLKDRGVTEEIINQLEDEKQIDTHVIPLMEDNDLAKYIPSYGDRLAARNWCKNNTLLERRKTSLFEKLRTKLKMRKGNNANNNSNKEKHNEATGPSKKRGKASHRKVEIGWIHFEKGQFKQVRTKQGGGTRTIDADIESGMDSILQKGKELFFPGDISTKGTTNDFRFEIWDYKENPINDDVTIGAIYETTCMPRLRFYVV